MPVIRPRTLDVLSSTSAEERSPPLGWTLVRRTETSPAVDQNSDWGLMSALQTAVRVVAFMTPTGGELELTVVICLLCETQSTAQNVTLAPAPTESTSSA